MTWNPAVGVPMLVVGIIVLVLVWLFGQPRKPGQGKRMSAAPKSRQEPRLDDEPPADAPPDDVVTLSGTAHTQPQQGDPDIDLRDELERLGAALNAGRKSGQSGDVQEKGTSGQDADEPPRPSTPNIGRRPAELPVDHIVTLYVMARDGERFRGPDIVVAAEKTGLEFGDMGIFHRLLDGNRSIGPIFSVANMVRPGSFDMSAIDALDTAGLSCFMTLPAPVSALDGWDAMLPAAQRLAELLGGQVLDSEHNALGRQRIAHIRDELRGWDRRHAGEDIQFDR